MNTQGTAMSVDRRKFLRRTLQAAAATQLGWVASACSGRQTGGPGDGVPPGGNGKQGFRSTEWLGDVTLSPGQLRDMQAGPYILHARAGTLSRVPAEKALLPHDPQGHVQTVELAMAPDRTIYVNQNTLMCRSRDGGRSWDVSPRPGKHGRHLSNSERRDLRCRPKPREKRTHPGSWSGARPIKAAPGVNVRRSETRPSASDASPERSAGFPMTPWFCPSSPGPT